MRRSTNPATSSPAAISKRRRRPGGGGLWCRRWFWCQLCCVAGCCCKDVHGAPGRLVAKRLAVFVRGRWRQRAAGPPTRSKPRLERRPWVINLHLVRCALHRWENSAWRTVKQYSASSSIHRGVSAWKLDVCARACVCARVRACVCVCVHWEPARTILAGAGGIAAVELPHCVLLHVDAWGLLS